MSLLAIKGTYQNGQLVLDEQAPTHKLFSVIVTFLEEKQPERLTLSDTESERQWQTTLAQPQPKLEQLALLALQQAQQGKTIKKGFDEL